ncbi:TetR/AcrR family transcriptional regulator [Pseudonocardia endophytica]|uniref:TetR family transcriptional regulator n=1 Tax=Pseudonocardia endophytica TaxID=401976 RepID=A0A4R1HII8_PSEEN|nr:TetR/AcrR family transcriptional regulator [Pseudonocardia endophytica]TCK20683.1 TetR family transcriptional regulator [Pseudonocardia endophytica]
MPQEQKPRRDPARRTRILTSAAELISRSGYHSVGMADIGTAAGIVGSGIYRHFESKAAILAELLEDVMNNLTTSAASIVDDSPDDRTAVTRLVRNHVDVVIHDRRIMQVYHREARNLPARNLRQLRRAQRLYIEEWATAVAAIRTDLADSESRLLVHAAIGAIQSILFHSPGLPEPQTATMLRQAAHSCLGVEATDGRLDLADARQPVSTTVEHPGAQAG